MNLQVSFSIIILSLLLSLSSAHANICAVSISKLKDKSSSQTINALDKKVPNDLELATETGEVSTTKASNFYSDVKGRVFSGLRDMAQMVLQSPAKLNEMSNVLTQALARLEMSFQVKDEKTGYYNKTVKVKVNAAPIPITKSFLNKIRDGISPIQRSLRSMSQSFLSTENITVEILRKGLDNISKEQATDAQLQEVINIVGESVYLEKKLINPVMKDYPFASIIGSDIAANITKKVFSLFEYNAGTPSGLSNNIQVLNLIQKKYPKLFKTFAGGMLRDRTYATLKKVVKSNADSWTGNHEGITVVLGPGKGNAAHPDVARISRMSDQLLVKPEELYTDANGWIRLNTGEGQKHPVVTGIYTRIEEAYLLQSTELRIPIRDPKMLDNKELQDKLSVSLEPGVQYQWIKDAAGTIIDVKKDSAGKPLQSVSSYKMGVDPSRPDAPVGDFAQAILGKKLWSSVVGGRILDDKRLLKIISQVIAPHFARGKEKAAGPSRTLEINEYKELYESTLEQQKKFVVKVPDESGGVGVYLLINMNPKARTEIIEMVKRDPHRYVIQEFTIPSLVTATYGKEKFIALTGDIRTFTMMDAEGNVYLENQSFLVRLAKYLSASSNTSLGGGYGVAFVTNSLGVGKIKQSLGKISVLPKIKPLPYLGTVRTKDFKHFLHKLGEALYYSSKKSHFPLTRDSKIVEELIDLHRDVMDLMRPELSSLMSDARNYQRGDISSTQFHSILRKFTEDLQSSNEYSVSNLKSLIHEKIKLFNPLSYETTGRSQKQPHRKELEALLETQTVEPFKVQEVRYRGTDVEIFVTSILRSSKDSEVQKIIDEVNNLGGVIHQTRMFDPQKGQWLDTPPAARVNISNKGIPSIEVSLIGLQRGLEALHHELAHVKNWYELKQNYIKQGYSPLQAAKKAQQELVDRPEAVFRDEFAAVRAEMDAATLISAFNSGRTRALKFFEPIYLHRTSYPAVEALRRALFLVVHRNENANAVELTKWMDQLILNAHAKRSQAIEYWQQTNHSNANRYIAYFEAHKIFDLLFKQGEIDRFDGDFTLPQFVDLYNQRIAILSGKYEISQNETVQIFELKRQSNDDQQQQQ